MSDILDTNPLVTDSMDPVQVKAAGKKEKSIRRQELEDVAFLLGSAEGKRFFWRLFDVTGVFANSFDGSFRTYFNEGRRIIGTTVLNDVMEASPSAFGEMIKQFKRDNQ